MCLHSVCVLKNALLSTAYGAHLANGHGFTLRADHLHLYALHEALQLVTYVPRSSHGAELDEVLVAPLC